MTVEYSRTCARARAHTHTHTHILLRCKFSPAHSAVFLSFLNLIKYLRCIGLIACSKYLKYRFFYESWMYWSTTYIIIIF